MKFSELPKAVIFDWDNTLADGWGSITEAMNAARAAYGQEPVQTLPWSVEEAKKHCTRALRVSFPEWFGTEWEKAKDIFYEIIHRTHLEKLKPLPGADELLRWLDAQGIPLFIVSNKRGDVLRREVAHLGWTPLFQAIIGANDVKIDKPARDPVDKALFGTGLSPEKDDIWFVGDKEIDVLCALNTSCRPVLLHDLEEAEKTGTEWAFSDCATFLQRLIICAVHHIENDPKRNSTMSDAKHNVQDVFLNYLRKHKTPTTVFLVNGVKLQGIVTWFDNFSLLLRRDSSAQLVYKHAISTVMPNGPIQLFEEGSEEEIAE